MEATQATELELNRGGSVMYQIFSGEAGILSVPMRAINNPEQWAWGTEAEAIAEYHEQKRVYPRVRLVVIEYTRFGGPHRIVIDDRKS